MIFTLTSHETETILSPEVQQHKTLLQNSPDATCNTQQVSGGVVVTGRTFTLDYLNIIK